MGHPHEDLVRRGFAAFGRGDLDAIRAFLAPDAVWHIAGRSPLSGTLTGVDAILARFMELYQASGFSLRQQVHDVVAGDAHTIALIHEHAEREGAMLDLDEVLVAHIESGQVTEAWVIPADQHAFDTFFA